MAARRSLLIVDDEVGLTSTLREFFEPRGLAVRVANEGAEGLRLCQEQPPDVLILDLHMPGLDGVSLLKTLRQSSAHAVKVIVLTAHDVEHQREVEAIGVDGFFSKPFALSELTRRVQELVGEPVGPRAAAAAPRREAEGGLVATAKVLLADADPVPPVSLAIESEAAGTLEGAARYQLAFARNSEEVRKLLAEFRPDIVVMATELPARAAVGGATGPLASTGTLAQEIMASPCAPKELLLHGTYRSAQAQETRDAVQRLGGQVMEAEDERLEYEDEANRQRRERITTALRAACLRHGLVAPPQAVPADVAGAPGDLGGYYRTLQEAGQVLVRFRSVQRLAMVIAYLLYRNMRAEFAAVFLQDRNGDFCLAARRGVDGPPADCRVGESHPLVEWLRQHRGILDAAAAAQGPAALAREFGALHGALGVPCFVSQHLLGFVLLGPRRRHGSYTREDLALLSALANQVAVALENIRLSREVTRSERSAFLGMIAAGVAHELRNPLTAVKTFLQLLPEKLQRPGPPDQDFFGGYYQTALDQVDKLDRIIDGLLTYARPQDPVFEPQDLRRVIEDVVLLLGHVIKQGQVTLHQDYPEELPPVYGDKGQLQQIFVNLVSNAVQAMSDRKVRELWVHASRKGPEVEVSVQDTGRGIAPEDREKVFTPFFTKRHEGTGLGLAIVQRLVENHGGSIEFVTEVGRGTTFYVVLHTTREAIDAAKVRRDVGSGRGRAGGPRG